MELILALDFAEEQKLFSCIEAFNPEWCVLKIGLEAYTALGPSVVKRLIDEGYRIFLDLKFHDIPNTVARACKAAADLGIFMLNVHASGGMQMMEAARQALLGPDMPHLIAVTVLTSQETAESEVLAYAKDAKKAGLDGVVCSALEVPSIKSTLGQDFLTVTPGIRLADDAKDDQVRVVTPEKAKALGSDFAVIGRSITKSENPAETLRAIYQDVHT